MPTKNRRVAAYLPPHVDKSLEDFKLQRGIKGDSEALIAILSEYLQVSQEVAYPSSLNLLQRIETLEAKVNSLKSELLSELKTELQTPRIEKGISELPSMLQGELLANSEPKPDKTNSELLSESKVSLLAPMTGSQLSKRFNLTDPDGVAKSKNHRKNSPEKFTQWLINKDPDGIAWEYHVDDKLYHPVQFT
jgi:hypothetical protein